MITGVVDFIGAYIAIRFAKSGYHVAVLARDKNTIIKDLNSTKN